MSTKKPTIYHEVTGFRTSDQQLFVNAVDAARHELELLIATKFPIPDNEVCRNYANALINNRAAFMAVLDFPEPKVRGPYKKRGTTQETPATTK